MQSYFWEMVIYFLVCHFSAMVAFFGIIAGINVCAIAGMLSVSTGVYLFANLYPCLSRVSDEFPRMYHSRLVGSLTVVGMCVFIGMLSVAVAIWRSRKEGKKA